MTLARIRETVMRRGANLLAMAIEEFLGGQPAHHPCILASI